MSIIYDALKKLENSDESGDSLSKASLNKNSAKPMKPPMAQNKKNTFILIGLLTAAVLIFSFTAGRRYLVEKSASLFSLIKKEDFSEQQKSLGFNPPLFSKDNSRPKGTAPYHLEGIIYGLDFPIAIINGNSFKQDDSIDGYKIAEITESTVELINTKDKTKLILSIEF